MGFMPYYYSSLHRQFLIPASGRVAFSLVWVILFSISAMLLPFNAYADSVLDDLQYKSIKKQQSNQNRAITNNSGNELIQGGESIQVPAPPVAQPGASGISVPTARTANDFSYRIGPQDELSIEVFQVQELNHKARVNTQGFITMPLIGAIEVGGLTVEEAERHIEKVLGEKYLQDPHVTLSLSEFASQRITLEGWIKKPGIYPLKGKTTLLQAMAMGGGVERLGDATEVVVFREIGGGNTVGYKIDVTEVRSGKLPNPLVLNNDIIVVPEHGSKSAFESVTGTLRSFLGILAFPL
jgi:polysaccharide export outer membrane protein